MRITQFFIDQINRLKFMYFYFNQLGNLRFILLDNSTCGILVLKVASLLVEPSFYEV